MSVPVRTVITMRSGTVFSVNEDYARVRRMISEASPLATPGFLELSDGDGEPILVRRDEIASVKDRGRSW